MAVRSPRSPVWSRASASRSRDGKTMFPDGAEDADAQPIEGAVTVQYPHEKEAPAAARPRRHRPARGELHRLHALRPQLPRLVHLHRGPQGRRRRRAARAASPARSTSSTASTSTTRCACTAASASRCARSTPCSGARSTSTPSPASPTCSTTRTRLGEWMETVPDFEAYEAGSEAKVKKVHVTASWRDVVAQNIAFGIIAAVMVVGALRVVTTKNVVHAALCLVPCSPASAPASSCSAPSSSASPRCSSTSAPSSCCSCSASCSPRRRSAESCRPHRTATGRWPSVSPSRLPASSATRSSTPSATTSCRRRLASRLTAERQRLDLLDLPHPVRGVSVLLLAALVGAIVLARKD